MAKEKLRYRYEAAPGAGYSDREAQVIGTELERMVRSGIEIVPETVVQRAADASNPLHRHFTWDDAQAAESYRKQEARQLCNHLVRVEFVGDQERRVKAWFNVTVHYDEPQSEEAQQQYVSVTMVRNDKDLRAQAVERLWRELLSWQQRALSLDAKEFEGIFDAIETLSFSRK